MHAQGEATARRRHERRRAGVLGNTKKCGQCLLVGTEVNRAVAQEFAVLTEHECVIVAKMSR